MRQEKARGKGTEDGFFQAILVSDKLCPDLQLLRFLGNVAWPGLLQTTGCSPALTQ